MFKVKSISIKNFMSFGNVKQDLPLDTEKLTLILGENCDTIGNTGNSRNGAGKTSILNAICFALFGESISHIKKDNLINLTNGKNLEVVLEFQKNNIEYRIERGRKPNYFKFFIAGKEDTHDTNESQGDSDETQRDVVKIIGLSPQLFKQIVGLNTNSEPFLSLDAKAQREIIEELLGITQLSDKANNLKELIKETKAGLERELFSIKTIQSSNAKIQESISDLKRRSSNWERDHENGLNSLQEEITNLLELDVDNDIDLHNKYSRHQTLSSQLQKTRREKTSKENSMDASLIQIKYLQQNLKKTEDHSCHTCGQKIHDEKQEEIKKTLNDKIDKETLLCGTLLNEVHALEGEVLLAEKELNDIGDVKKPFYRTIEEAYKHRSKLDSLGSQLERKAEEKNPYDEHIISQQENLLQKVNMETSQGLQMLLDHQEFLLKLLTNKDSAVRKKIIDQNLNYLNWRLGHYVEKLGLPHNVTFMNDLSVEIKEHGRDLDFDNLSRGEKTRLILGLSFAFRDVYESMNSTVNMLFLDEIIDLGLDGAGLEHALELLKKMSRENNKSIFLVSHKEELISRVSSVVTVVKENGFSSIRGSAE